MKKQFALFLFTLFCIAAPLFGQTHTPPVEDFQVWGDTQISIPLKKSADKKSDRITLQLFGTLRYGRDLNDLIDERVGLGFEFRLNKNWTITPAYLYRTDRSATGRREYENRLRIDVQYEHKFKYFAIKERNRLEQRVRNSRSDQTRYRNRFLVSIPVLRNKKELFAPFVSTEPFYEFQTKHWARNEFMAGIAKKFSPKFTAEIYYMLQNNRGNFLKYVHAIGLNFRFRIG